MQSRPKEQDAELLLAKVYLVNLKQAKIYRGLVISRANLVWSFPRANLPPVQCPICGHEILGFPFWVVF